VRDHFIFSVESTGALRAAELVSEAIACMVDKAELVLGTLNRLAADEGEEEEDAMATEHTSDGNL